MFHKSGSYQDFQQRARLPRSTCWDSLQRLPETVKSALQFSDYYFNYLASYCFAEFYPDNNMEYIYAIFSYLIYRLRACVGCYRNPEMFHFPGSLSFLPIQSMMLFYTVAKRGSKNLFLALMRDQNGKKFRNWDKMKSSKETDFSFADAF